MISVLSGNGPLLVGPIPLDQRVNLANCVAYYDFKNVNSYPGSGTAVTDLSNRANNGTITVVGTGTYAFGTDRQRKLVFNTAAISGNNNVAVLSASSLTDFGVGTGDFALEVWVKFNELRTSGDNSAAAILGLDNAAGVIAARIIMEGANPPNRFICAVGASAVITSAANSMVVNTWYHLVFTRIGTACTFYINGASAGTATSSASGNANGRLTAGVNASNASRKVIGDYGAIRVYKGRGLTAAEVSKNYNLERIYYI
jgi:hypothetical protein